MTTNQTIDGVPRALLQSLYTDTVQQWGVGGNAASQLRALLGANPVENIAGHHPACRAVDDYKPGECSHSCKPAAQPQGEPVAWMQPNQGGMCISNEVKQHSIKLGGAPASAVAGYSIPLYAEQPAPVAVVLPERRDFSPQSDSEWGWNACLDEVARLTATVRIPEPLVMTDGLHTYEYVTGHNAAIDKMLGAKSR